jgi:phosphoenolpyruvate carboxylase
MNPTLDQPTVAKDRVSDIFIASDLFLTLRLKLVEDLWESVLRSECGQPLVDLLKQLRALCSPEGKAMEAEESSITQVIESLDLNEAIRAARAFALYFQLINIVEQHYEQRDQQLNRRATYQEPPRDSWNGTQGTEKGADTAIAWGANLL